MDNVNLHEAVGGSEACCKLAVAFYARVARDPVLRPLFPGKTLRCAIEAFTAFLVQFLGGPPEDAQSRWWLSLRESHLRFSIGQAERDAWMKNMTQALAETPIEEPARSALHRLFDQSSAYLANVGTGAHVAPHEPPASPIEREISRHWRAQLTLDEAVAAVRGGAADRAIVLAETDPLPAYFRCSPSAFASLLALMIASGDRTLLGYVEEKLRADPSLIHERCSGRTLLHAAAAAGNIAAVDLLLSLGADASAIDDGGHTPLYAVANECDLPAGATVVRILIQAGAKVDARDGVKRCTPLHMAARRGTIAIAEALLNCGADLELPDSVKDTPLRRAVNCNQTEMAAFLLSRGANPHSKGSKGFTPVSVARTAAMKRLFPEGR